MFERFRLSNALKGIALYIINQVFDLLTNFLVHRGPIGKVVERFTSKAYDIAH